METIKTYSVLVWTTDGGASVPGGVGRKQASYGFDDFPTLNDAIERAHRTFHNNLVPGTIVRVVEDEWNVNEDGQISRYPRYIYDPPATHPALIEFQYLPPVEPLSDSDTDLKEVRISELMRRLDRIMAKEGDLLITVGNRHDCQGDFSLCVEHIEGDPDPTGLKEYLHIHGGE